MSILHFETEEERVRFIEALSSHLSISISCEADYDCYSNREYSRARVTLYFDDQEISSDSDTF